MEDKMILAISFGTSYADAGRKSLQKIEQEMIREFPDWGVQKAYTSATVIKILNQRDGVAIDSVDLALEKAIKSGISCIVCQPTHFMKGYEYEKMVEQILKYSNSFQKVSIGDPLIGTHQDLERVAHAVRKEYDVDPHTATVLMGHGTGHQIDHVYEDLNLQFKVMGAPNMIAGTVEGALNLDSILSRLEAEGYQKTVLAPLMVVAGDHAVNDMAGNHRESWRTRLAERGIEVKTVLKGLGEIQLIRDIYVDHARDAVRSICQ